MWEKSTGDLKRELMGQADLDKYITENAPCFATANIADLLTQLYKECGISKAELARRAEISEVYLHQVLSGRRTPSRDRLLCICIGMGAELEVIQRLLKQSGFAELYPRIKRDAVMIYGILHRMPLTELNDKLFAENEKTLF